MRDYVHNHDEDLPVDRLGLSECRVDVMKKVHFVLGIGEKDIVCRVEHSPFMLDIEANGFAKAARGLNVVIPACSPLGEGRCTWQACTVHCNARG